MLFKTVLILVLPAGDPTNLYVLYAFEYGKQLI